MARKPRKDANIDRHGNKWRIRYVHDGKRYAVLVDGPAEDVKPARAKWNEIKAKLDSGDHIAPTNVTLRAWGETWIEDYLKRAVSTRSYERQSSIFRRHIAPALGDLVLQKLEPTRINRLYSEMEASGLHPATVRYAHIVLGSCLKAAVKIGKLSRNPVANASPPKSNTTGGGRALTLAELDKLLTTFREDPLFPIVALAAGTGARINELLALEWSAMDWNAKTLRIDAALKPTKNGLERGTPKTERSRRSIRLDDGLIALFKSERERQEAEQAKVRGIALGNVAPLRSLLPDGALIFPSSPVKPTKPRRHSPISKALAAHAAKIGLGALRFHDLRHTHATLLLQAGVPVAAVSARLGHANAAITLGIYSHSTTDAEAAAASVAGSLLSGVLKPKK